MDVKRFADELLVALVATGLFERVSLQTEGPAEGIKRTYPWIEAQVNNASALHGIGSNQTAD